MAAGAESLFDDAEGQSTATFTDTQFPTSVFPTDIEHLLDPSDPAAMAALAACDGMGISNELLRQACIHDVLVTGDPSVADALASMTPPDLTAAIIVEPTGDTSLLEDPTALPPPALPPDLGAAP